MKRSLIVAMLITHLSILCSVVWGQGNSDGNANNNSNNGNGKNNNLAGADPCDGMLTTATLTEAQRNFTFLKEVGDKQPVVSTTNDFSYWFTLGDTTNCPIQWCSVLEWVGNASLDASVQTHSYTDTAYWTATTDIVVEASGGTAGEMTTSGTDWYYKQFILYCGVCTGGCDAVQHFNISMSNCSSSYDYSAETIDISASNLEASLSYTDDTLTPSFVFNTPTITCSVTQCCASRVWGTYYTNSYGSYDYVWDVVENNIALPGTLTLTINSPYQEIRRQWEFRVGVALLGDAGTMIIDSGGVTKFSFRTVCSSLFTYCVNTGAYPNGLSRYQYVPLNDVTKSYFTMPAVTVTDPSVPIIGGAISGSHSQFTASTTFDAKTGELDSDGNEIIRPVDITTSKRIQFYYHYQMQGGSYVPSQLQYLYLGCVSPLSVSNATSFVETVDSILTSTNTDYYYDYTIQNPSITLEYCYITENTIIRLQLDGVNSTENAVFFDPTCAQPCTTAKIDLMYVDRNISFQIQSTDTTGDTHNSPQVNTSAGLCGAMHSSITDHDLILNIGRNSSFEFSQFTCDIPSCCPEILTYITLSSASDKSQIHSLIAAPVLNVTNSKLNVTVPNTVVANYTLWIHGSNKLLSAFSQQINVAVTYDCASENITFITDMPTEQLQNTTFVVQDNGIYKYNISFIQNELTSYTLNLSTRISTEYSNQTYCPTTYAIIVRQNNLIIAEELYSQYFTFSSSGIFQIVDFSTVQSTFEITMIATNGNSTSDSINLIDLAIEAVPVVVVEVLEMPNFPPNYILPPESLTLQINSTNQTEEEIVTYTLPQVVDANSGDTWTVRVDGLQSFMVYDESTGQIQIDQSASEVGSYTISVKIVDQSNAASTSKFDIIIEEKEAEEETGEAEAAEIDLGFGIQIEEESDGEFEGVVIDKNSSDSGEIVWPQNCSAQIESISSLGELEISFNATMEQKRFEEIDAEMIDIYVQPSKPRELEEGHLNLTWKVKEFRRKELTIALTFENPAYVSPDKVQDKLVFHIKQKGINYFYSDQLKINLHDHYHTLEKKIRRQMTDSDINRGIGNSAENAEVSLRILLIVTFIMSIFLQGSALYFTLMIRALQIALHLPLLKVLVPSNVSMVFGYIIPVVGFDVLDPEWTTELVFSFDEERQQELQNTMPMDQWMDMGYDSHNSLLLLGSLAIFMAIYFLKIIVYIFFQLISWYTGKCTSIAKELKKQLIFGEVIAILKDAYFEFLMAIYLQQRAPLKTTNGERAGVMAAGIFTFLILIAMPLAFLYVLTRPLDVLWQRDFQQTWGGLYEGLNPSDRYSVSYSLIVILRRLIFVAIAIYVPSQYNYFQIQGILALNLAIAIYQGRNKPLDTRFQNRIEYFNECFVSSASIMMMCFTEYLPDLNMQQQTGWAMLFKIFIILTVNLAIILFYAFKANYIVYKKYKIRFVDKVQKLKDKIMRKLNIRQTAKAPAQKYLTKSEKKENIQKWVKQQIEENKLEDVVEEDDTESEKEDVEIRPAQAMGNQNSNDLKDNKIEVKQQKRGGRKGRLNQLLKHPKKALNKTLEFSVVREEDTIQDVDNSARQSNSEDEKVQNSPATVKHNVEKMLDQIQKEKKKKLEQAGPENAKIKKGRRKSIKNLNMAIQD